MTNLFCGNVFTLVVYYMMVVNMNKKYYLTFVVILILDQLTKYVIDLNMRLYESITVIPNFFYITYARNEGAAWSILSGKTWFFVVIGIIAFTVMGYVFKKSKDFEVLTKLGLILMMSGTVGNLIDRICFGYVRDFLDFIIFNYDFPIFNVADMALCIGVGILMLDVVLEELGVVIPWKK